jgi:general secretion pathway protein H
MTSHSDIRIQAREAGFTLIEMIVVLTILALMTVLITANGIRVSPAVHARAAAQAISGALRSARSEAVVSNRSVSFTLDVVNRFYQWGQTPRQVLTNDLSLSLLTSRDQLAPDGVGQIRFDPDGGSSGGRVSIEGGGVVWWVGIDWLSGRVSIEQKPS